VPIYAYKCSQCGHEKDVLQKISDAPLTECPACGAHSFTKQVTAAGFQLKGSGWYVTDFRDGANKKDATKKEAASEKDAGSQGAAAPTSSTGDGGTSSSGPAQSSSGTTDSKPAAPAPAAD